MNKLKVMQKVLKSENNHNTLNIINAIVAHLTKDKMANFILIDYKKTE